MRLKNCNVYSNDLNPESYKYLLDNIKINKINKVINNFNLFRKIIKLLI